MEREATRLRQLWAAMFREIGTPIPSLTQFFVWLGGYPPVIVELAIHSTLKKAFIMSQRGEQMSFPHQVNYATKVMKMETEQDVERELDALKAQPERVSAKKPAKPVINPFNGNPLLNPLTGKPVVKEED
jgi:hypothetical protein